MKHSFKKTLSVLLSALIASGVMAVAPLTITAAETDEPAVAAPLEEAAPEAVGAEAEESVSYSTSGSYEYYLTNNQAYIYKYNGNISNLTVPNKLNGYTVVGIGNNAFSGNTTLQTIKFPATLHSIDNYAFYNCTALQTITVPASVTKLGAYVFYGCTALTSASIEGAVGDPGTDTFYGCTALKSVTIAEGCTSISDFMFKNCTALSSIKIPSTITIIGKYAFANCTALPGFTLPGNVRTVDTGAFEYCNLSVLYLNNKLTTIGAFSFAWNYKLKSVTIPNSVTQILHDAFYSAKALTSLTIGSGVKTMEESVFGSCSKLKSVSIAYGTTVIGTEAFEFCYELTSVVIPSTVTAIGKANGNSLVDNNVFRYHHKNMVIYGTYNSFAHRFANANSIAFSSSIPAVKPAAPTVTLSNKSNGIRADWNKVTGAVKYKVFYRKYGTSNWSSAQTANNYYPLLNLTAGAGYQVQVQSIGSGIQGNYSAVKTLIYVPQVKPNVSLSNKSNGIRAEWGKVAGATAYIVYYKPSGANWSSTTTKNNYFAYLNTNSGTLYCVQVQPVFNGTKGLYSKVKSLTFIGQPAVTLTKVSNGAKLSWNAVGGANKFEVAKKPVGSSSYVYYTTTKRSIVDTSGKSGDVYQVRAMYATQNNGTAYGAWSSSKKVA